MWVDLAREYVILGQNRHALYAIRAAVALAPMNRFVLRSAARFHLHEGDPERAHDLLRRSPLAQRDPWVLAAEIATATVADRTSSFTKVGRRMIGGERLAAAHITELASALATLEMDAGNRRRSRKLFLQALAAPTENTVAQASWASRHAHVLEFEPEYLDLPRTFEAGAWENYRGQDWSSAVAEAEHWQLDEPFASRSAMFGSFLASVALEDYARAVLFAQRGLQADPRNIVLLNNLAFALASSGRTLEARAALTRIPVADLDVDNRVANLATSGLVAYRHGDPAAGRALYEQAIQLAETAGLREKRAWAMLFLAREEITARSPRAPEMLSRSRGALEHFSGPTQSVARMTFARLVERAAGRE
jgi:tetratricopeptide (TPR) repeat protein